MIKQDKIVVLSLGGSMINGTNGFDLKFLKDFRNFILTQVKVGYRFIIVCGGGRVCREYNAAAKAVGLKKHTDFDWIGIFTTHFNANFMRILFGNLAHEEVVKTGKEKMNWKRALLFSGGWVPGHSTDYDAVLLAKRYGATTVVNLSNIEYVYDKDPNKFKDAKKIENISWTNFRKIVGNKWVPGANAPFDPIASQEAQKNKMKVVVMNGGNLKDLAKVLKGEEKIVGTIIK